MDNLSEVVRSLWKMVGDVQPTDHQKGLQAELDRDANIRVQGELGSGKTFAVRNYLTANNIQYQYFTAREVAEMDEDDLSQDTFESVETIVVDNFDVIPETREALDSVYRNIELSMESMHRGVWLVFPGEYRNDWFETVLGNYRDITIKKSNIDHFTVDRVRSNLDGITGNMNQIDRTDPDVNHHGYHGMIRNYLTDPEANT